MRTNSTDNAYLFIKGDDEMKRTVVLQITHESDVDSKLLEEVVDTIKCITSKIVTITSSDIFVGDVTLEVKPIKEDKNE